MRGYGESDKPKDRRAYDLSELTSDVSEVIKALGHKEYAPCASKELTNRVRYRAIKKGNPHPLGQSALTCITSSSSL